MGEGRGTTSCNVDAIREAACGGVGPAAATILRDVLVAVVSGQGSAAQIADVVTLRYSHVGVRKGRFDYRWLRSRHTPVAVIASHDQHS